jgi:hypothetical protein
MLVRSSYKFFDPPRFILPTTRTKSKHTSDARFM